jgi:uncharacterized protein YecE (DUF72 family)
MPTAATFRGWAARVPADFTFAVKASRYLTHVQRLREPREPVQYLLERATELGPHLGPILLQLPPDLPADLDRLARTLEAFPPSIRVAVEPRHASWFGEGLRTLLTAHGAALCLADRRGPVTPVWATADWAYLRFHGGHARPASCYGERSLATWARRVRAAWPGDVDGYVYFNNDHGGCALRDAAVFGRSLTEERLRVARQPDVPPDVVQRRTPG